MAGQGSSTPPSARARAGLVGRAKQWARGIKRNVLVLWLAARHPRVPWHAKAVAGLVAAYALSPIDLIPDFIPVLGYLDDLLIVPLGILLALRLMPAGLREELAEQAAAIEERPRSRIGLALILAIWIAGAALCLWLLWPAPPVERAGR